MKNEMAEDYLWEVLNPILVEALSMVSNIYIPSILTIDA